ncbi:hypothetical protein BKK79_27275 [Cupriavidus sp. USMAA2-4]|uniref:tripartite tricarboxylate transporter substrate-binding protein n=1 Tax=Cupriavidus sp. USMAA2-4 TaxID=876364 RepID=UPI0008A6F772|nr:tripartite tricarboxylate transporter substrate-binding protein [Cupriavidus sp. USMAA2-4]AOY95463.1 hypothetical protein BKK79_27275 [Cupriavidus sp. USMAA2-4]
MQNFIRCGATLVLFLFATASQAQAQPQSSYPAQPIKFVVNSSVDTVTRLIGQRQRYKNIPNVPSFAEAGFKGFEPYGWYGVFVSAGTLKPAVDKLYNEIARIVRTPEVAARFEEDPGLIVTVAGPDAFAADMKKDSQVWGRAIRDGNIRVD